MLNHDFPEIILTRRNNEKLLYKGYSFHKRKEKNNKKYWRCTNRKCSATLKTSLTNVILTMTNHTCHDPSFIENEVLYAANYRKNRALTTRETSRDIIDHSYEKTSIENSFYFPKYKSMRNRISEIRKCNGLKFNNLINGVPEIIKKTSHGENFYLYDSGEFDDERVLIFSTASNLLHLEHASVWICDGTFRSCPLNFYQIYTIMAVVNNSTFPLLYFLMRKKSVSAYEKGFNFVKNNLKNYPKLIIIDFEMAALVSIKQIFPESRVEGCFFHLSQSIYRQVQKEKFVVLYKRNLDFRQLIKIITCIAYVPINELEKAKNEVDIYFKGHIFYDEINPIWSWFKRNYMENKNNKFTVFNPQFWSVFKRTTEFEPLTINALESWHRSLNQYVRVYHPSLKELGLELLKEQRKVEFNLVKNFYNKMQITDNVDNKRIKIIRDIAIKYGDFSIVHYLKMLANLMK
ncbi:hypothetical protein DMUE_2189 [Dictyocoela muelleri]|nr:hypothetical protein DMUE_2189 [Dictyocoela muelleri]